MRCCAKLKDSTFVGIIFYSHMADQSHTLLFTLEQQGAGWCLSLSFSPPFLSIFSSLLTPQDVITPTDVSLQSSYDKSTQKLHISEFRICYLKQSMHVISTSRPSKTNGGPVFFCLSLSLCYSLIGMAFMAGAQQLFPSTCFSLNTSPLLALVPKQGSCRGWNLASLHTDAQRKQ